MQLIKCNIEPTTAVKKMIQGFNGVIRHGNNPYRVGPSHSVKITPIMGNEPNANRVFLVQLLTGVEVVAVAHTTVNELDSPDTIKVGDTVELNPLSHAGMHHQCPEGRADNKTAVIRNFMGEAYPGGVVVEDDLRGCRFWNINDLQKVK